MDSQSETGWTLLVLKPTDRFQDLARSRPSKPRMSVTDLAAARRACVPCNAPRQPWEDLTWLQRWAAAGSDPVADFDRYLGPTPENEAVADCGDGVFLTRSASCDANVGRFPLSIHIWNEHDLSHEKICDRVRSMAGDGITVKYVEGGPIASMVPLPEDVARYATSPGDLLVHCVAGHYRGPVLAAIAKVARGCDPVRAIAEVERANLRVRGLPKRLDPLNVNEVRDLARRIGVKPSPPIFGWLHVATIGRWKPILRELFSQIERSGLRAATSRVFVGVVGPQADLSWVPPWAEVVRRDGPLELGECSTLQALWDWSKSFTGPGKVWYAHTKGASHHDLPQITSWRDYLAYFNLLRWREASAVLDGPYDCCGCDWTVRDDEWFKGIGGRSGPGLVPGHGFEGNFWWSTLDHIRNLPAAEVNLADNRWCAEWSFVGCGVPRAFELHGPHVNRYAVVYPRSCYEGDPPCSRR